MSNVTVQKILIKGKDEVEVAIKYFSFLFALNSIKMAPKELQLLAFTAVRGNIIPKSARLEFTSRFNTTESTMANLKGILIKKKFLIEKDGKCKIRPNLSFSFKEKMVVQITLDKREKEEEE